MEIKLKKNFDSEVYEAWSDIEKQNDLLIFQKYKWNHEWSIRNNYKNNFRIIIVYIKNEPALIFPFFIKKFFFLKIISWIGDDLSDYLSPVVNKKLEINSKIFNEIWKKVLIILKVEADLILLNKQVKDMNYMHNPMTEYLYCKSYDFTYGINFNKYNSIANKKGKTIQKIKWSKKKLSNYGNLSFKNNIKIENKISLLSKILFWKKKTINSKQNIFKIYNENFFKKFIESKNIFFSGIKLDNKYISLSLNISNNQSTLYYIPAYTDEKIFQKYSPGKIHMYELIKENQKCGIEYFDFGNGNELYKSSWANDKRKIYYYIKSLSFFGSIFFFIYNYKKK